jgi:hypothetical protein
MTEQWVPFLEAVKRIGWRLFMPDYEAKPLLRAACSSERVRGRGQYEEAGRVAFAYGDDADQDPALIRVGRIYYVREIYPAEIDLGSLQNWIASMEDDTTPRTFSQSVAQILSAAQHPDNSAEDEDGETAYADAKIERRTGQRGLIEDWLRDRHKGTPPAHMTEDQRTADVHDYAANVAKTNLRPDKKTIRSALKKIIGR